MVVLLRAMGDFLKTLFKITFIVGVILAIVGAILRFFFVDIAVMGHNGMAPTLVAGDTLAIWRRSSIEIGDIVICQDPTGRSRYVTGRVIGKPGFEIRTERGQLVLNQQILNKNIAGELFTFNDTLSGRTEKYRMCQHRMGDTTHSFMEKKRGEFILKKRQIKSGYYLLGDNRTYKGEDSRYFGEVNVNGCLGTVFMRLKPAPPTGDDIQHSWLEWIK